MYSGEVMRFSDAHPNTIYGEYHSIRLLILYIYRLIRGDAITVVVLHSHLCFWQITTLYWSKRNATHANHLSMSVVPPQ